MITRKSVICLRGIASSSLYNTAIITSRKWQGSFFSSNFKPRQFCTAITVVDTETSSRPLAYIATIKSIEPIPGADKIEVANIKGWQVVVGKGKFKPGERCVYFEIDSVVPPWQKFVEDKLDRYGFRIKTIVLRGQMSQGYVVDLNTVASQNTEKKLKLINTFSENEKQEVPAFQEIESNQVITLEEGTNLTELIGVKKYLPQVSSDLHGNALKVFPSFIHKTDQNRIQNYPKYPTKYGEVDFEVTEKLEGSSITCYYKDGFFGICSRNFEIAVNPSTEDEKAVPVSVKTIHKLKIKEKMENLKKNIAIQGELIGPGINQNIYQVQEHAWKIFDVFLIDQSRYATRDERLDILKELNLENEQVPFIGIQKIGNLTVKDIVKSANGPSALLPSALREGIVFKSIHPSEGSNIISFKAISPEYEMAAEMKNTEKKDKKQGKNSKSK